MTNEAACDLDVLPSDLEVDDDGYPSEDVLNRIRHTRDVKTCGRWLVHTFPSLVDSLPCGCYELRMPSLAQRRDDEHAFVEIAYSTGGWSGQEDLIKAVESSIIGRLYMHSWVRGGHYVFHVPVRSL